MIRAFTLLFDAGLQLRETEQYKLLTLALARVIMVLLAAVVSIGCPPSSKTPAGPLWPMSDGYTPVLGRKDKPLPPPRITLDKNFEGALILIWESSPNWRYVKGCNVYRSLSPDGAKQKLNRDLLNRNYFCLNCDRQVVPKPSYYSVTCISLTGVESVSSPVFELR